MDGRSARWSGHRAARRAELANDARKAVHRLGPEVSMDELAAALGTSKSILYRYFSDKIGLQHAVGHVVVTRMMGALVEAAHTSSTPRENLRAVIGVYLEMVEGSPSVYSFVTQAPSGAVAPSAAGDAPATPLTSFLDAVSARVVVPIAVSLLGEDAEERAHTWATGAVGFVRGAGDRWLATRTSGVSRDRHALTDEVTAWLWTGIVGIAEEADITHGSSVVVELESGHAHQHRERP